jgi:hypothetical protein
VAAQERLSLINSEKVSFVGAWTLYGFHEDGFTSGIRAAENLGAKIPFDIIDARYIRGKGRRGMDSRIDRLQYTFARMILSFLQMLVMALTNTSKGKLD